MKIINLTQGFTSLVDDEDYERINNHSWVINKNGNYYRAMATINRKRIYLHRFILNINNSNIKIDHINGNALDNRKENLRICNQSQNSKNSKKSKSNTSGYKGVFFEKNLNKWKASIRVNYKQIHIGVFKNKVDAAKAYNQAALKYFGEFAKLNEVN